MLIYVFPMNPKDTDSLKLERESFLEAMDPFATCLI